MAEHQCTVKTDMICKGHAKTESEETCGLVH